ncbi:MAG TPA: MaoC family dehydratase N-terminal domain-containing protein [Aliidongia sp.]|nr:MaoC family dehydratase N-terminal domain-containing protein [Aliidongia sp.]
MAEKSPTDLGRWVGRRREAYDVVAFGPLRGLAAMLDMPPPPQVPRAAIPPAWHWLYFLSMSPQAALGEDGAEPRGEFLPPITLPRRMWAGGSFEFHQPLRFGERIGRVSTIQSIEEKSGKNGPLVFVTMRHEISGETGRAITEEQVIVFRSPPSPDQPAIPEPAPIKADWRREIVPDPILLFRFSALTFNAHRIHYDRPYATGTEGYPGLLVHGPLQALLLLELLRGELTRPIRRFEYRALGPIFDTGPFTVNGVQDGDEAHVWTADDAGNLGMMGVASL